MATAVGSMTQKYGLPPFREDGDFEQWLFELDMWKTVTDLPKVKQGPVLFLSLNAKVRQACAALSREEINAEDGVEKLVEKLRELYAVSKEQATFTAYELFENFKRPEEMNITDYINKFEQLNQKLVNYGVVLPTVISAYQLLKNANLPKEKRDLIRATLAELTYESMKKQIKAIYDLCISSDSMKDNGDIKIESDSVYYGQSGYNSYWRRSARNQNRGGRPQTYNDRRDFRNPSTSSSPSSRFSNDRGRGKRGACYVCRSIFHWADKCPDNPDKNFPTSEIHLNYFADEKVEQCFLEQEVAESLNCAIVDSGCPSNVCGANWLQCYIDTLPSNVDLREKRSDKVFRFGPSKAYTSLKQVNIPVHIGNIDTHILVDVVDCEVPLLLSKKFLKDAKCHLDCVNDCITLYGQIIDLQHTSSNHYCIPITNTQIVLHSNKDSSVKVFLTIDKIETRSAKEKYEIASKLHKQFGHPIDSKKLKLLLHDAQVSDTELLKLIDTVTDQCETCARYRRVRSRPVVAMPMAQELNDCLALDLKFINVRKKTHTVLHMIDVFTRFSQAVIIPSKHKEVIVNAILKQWVSLFGTPQSLLSDNGREFENALLRDVAELLGTRVCNTAAYAPWSNGVVERHNAVLENMVLKITTDTNCSVDNALVWSISAKNALYNNGGFSPNQLVFGRNPNLPSVLTAKPPQLRTHTPSELIAEHLNALHAARKAFMESEASKKLKTALSKQTRTATCKSYNIGDHIYYKRDDRKEWHGPAVIIGIDNKMAVVRHGGSFLRVSAVHLSPVRDNKSLNTAENIETNVTVNSGNTLNTSEYIDKQISQDILVTLNIDESCTEDMIDFNTPPVILETNVEEIQHIETADEPSVGDFNTFTENTPLADDLPSPVDNNINVSFTQPMPVIEFAQEPTFSNEHLCDSPVNNYVGASLIIHIPRIRDRVQFLDPDSNNVGEFVVISRAGKAKGKNKNWFNVKNLNTGVMKSVDFGSIPDWVKIQEEILYAESNNPEVLRAQQVELERWKEYNVYSEVKDTEQTAISTRWVITEKTDNDKTIVKARLVARGFEEDATAIRSDSPTISKENLKLVSAIAVLSGWKICSIDVKSAFLQGIPIDRTVHIVPPPEANTLMLWKLNKPVYGLRDASRSWYLTVCSELISKGASKSKYDNALFFWRLDSKLQGVICTHVDDFFFCGSQLFHTTVIEHLHHKFNLSKECFNNMLYTGIEITQTNDCISMHQNTYIESIKPLILSDNTPHRFLDKKEIRSFKGLVGQLQWTAKQTRPDLAFTACELSTCVKQATTNDVQRANKKLCKLKSDTRALCIPDIGEIKESSLVVYSDASHANLANSGSQGGFIIFLRGSNGNVAPLMWTSHKLKRVVKSPKAAETMALQSAAESAIFIKTLILEIYDLNSAYLPIICFVDNKSLVEAVHSTSLNDDKRSYIDICTLRNMLENKEITDMKWIASDENLADCLTKSTASSAVMMKVLSTGHLLLPNI